jgi:hypothetical protein
VNADCREATKHLKLKYIESVNRDPSDTELRKAILDFNDEGNNLVNAATGFIRKEFETKLAELGTKYKNQHKVTVPVVDVTRMAEQAKESAYDKARKVVGDTTPMNTGVGGTTGAAVGAGIGTAILPGLGTAIGAGFGLLVGCAAGAATGKKIIKEEDEFSQEKFVANLRPIFNTSFL